jgi:hypothetical protein
VSVKDNSQAASQTPADLRARRTRRVREKKAASKWLARRSDAPPSVDPLDSDAPPPAFDEDESSSGITDKLAFVESSEGASQFESGAPHAIDAALPEEELAARLEAPTVRPPSHPPPEEEPAQTKADVEESEPIAIDKLEKIEKLEKTERTEKIETIDTVPPTIARRDEPIDERVSGLPAKRSGGWVWMVFAALAIVAGIFGVRTFMRRAAKPPPIAVASPPPPEAKAAPTPEPSTTTPAPAPTVTKTAVEEREEARVLLEKKKAVEALPLALHAVEQDPSDAQTWLVLGAAHQDLGHGVDARDTFLQCTKKATTGPIHECRALLSYNGPR